MILISYPFKDPQNRKEILYHLVLLYHLQSQLMEDMSSYWAIGNQEPEDMGLEIEACFDV